jgi:hypothetical protein
MDRDVRLRDGAAVPACDSRKWWLSRIIPNYSRRHFFWNRIPSMFSLLQASLKVSDPKYTAADWGSQRQKWRPAILSGNNAI